MMSNLLRRFSPIARDQRGVSAVEFALLAPVMIGLYLGCVEISEGVSIDRKVSLTSATLANLTAQITTIPTADMTNILNASSAIIAPYQAGNLTMTVSCININATKVATVKWSVTRNGVVRSGTITVPPELSVANTQLVLAEASYNYTPTVGYTITGSLVLSDKMYMSPRISAPTYNATACT